MENLKQVNHFCLDRMVAATERGETMVTSEDIYSESGLKLYAKGNAIDLRAKERLIAHKLRKPLESSVTMDKLVNPNEVYETAREIFENVVSPLSYLMHDNETKILQVIRRTKLHPTAAMLLSLARSDHTTNAFRHAVTVAVMSVGFGIWASQENEDLDVLATAGLLHDLGEIYVNPEYLRSTRPLTPEEWRHVVSHPKITEMVLSELMQYPPKVCETALNHHERMNGGGYPRRLRGEALSTNAVLLSVAESLSGILVSNNNPFHRAILALKLVPGEFAHEGVRHISKRLSSAGMKYVSHESINKMAAIELAKKVCQVIRETSKGFFEISRLHDLVPADRDIIDQALESLSHLKVALVSTGLDECFFNPALGDACFFHPEEELDLDMVPKELRWRLRNLSRDLYLHASLKPSHLSARFVNLAHLMSSV